MKKLFIPLLMVFACVSVYSQDTRNSLQANALYGSKIETAGFGLTFNLTGQKHEFSPSLNLYLPKNDVKVQEINFDYHRLYGNYQVSYGRNAYWLDSKIDWYDEFADGKGKFIVKELNADKTVINIEFQDLNIPILKGLRPDKSKMIEVKGNMKYSIDF